MWPSHRTGKECARLGDDRRIAIRPVAETDRDGIQAFIRNLAPETRRLRFFSPVRELSEAMLDALVHPDPARERVVVAIAGPDAAQDVVAVAQYAAAERADECEVALVLADEIQGQGLGTRLLARLLDAANRGGYRRAVGDVLRENGAMIALARRAGFEVAINTEDRDLLRISRPLEQPARDKPRPRIADLVSRSADVLRSMTPHARGRGSSGLEPV
jgi:acetyltransferase